MVFERAKRKECSGREDLNLRPTDSEFGSTPCCPCIFNDLSSSHSFSFLFKWACSGLMGDLVWVTHVAGSGFYNQNGTLRSTTQPKDAEADTYHSPIETTSAPRPRSPGSPLPFGQRLRTLSGPTKIPRMMTNTAIRITRSLLYLLEVRCL